MPSPNDPQDPYGAGDGPDPSSRHTPPLGSTPPSSTPPPYTGTSGYGSSPYDAAPPAHGGYGPSPYGYAYPKNNLAVWSLVLGLVGIFGSLGCFGFLPGIPAIIVGNRAKAAAAQGQADNPGMATAGVVLGWVATVLSALALVALIAIPSLLAALLAFAGLASSTTSP